ncbi:hypothetical protein OS493_001170 [Desmophyllum pertusum]|uniref:C2H2-type domain-containing protein n=1 Tax=Desmophyllum pertusum TaxID=174260 RepID=A0A9X0D7K2_9CNID|nr:hypothetical protein OS493_001170 [Desmophyllum pertusum]
MALTFPEEGSQEPVLNLLQSGAGRKRSAEDDVDVPTAKKTRYPAFGKIHECSHCGRLFNRTDSLKRHEKQAHERRAAQREYRCNACGETFRNMAPFRAHQKTAHTKPSTKKRPGEDDDSEPKPTKLKTTPIETKATPSSSWQEDPRAIIDLSEDQQSSVPEYRRHWHQIRTRFNRQNRLLDWYNYRLSSLQPQEIIRHLDQIFTDQSTGFKLNVSFGFILRNNETGELQYHYASRNNEQVFEEPFQIATAPDLDQVREALIAE